MTCLGLLSKLVPGCPDSRQLSQITVPGKQAESTVMPNNCRINPEVDCFEEELTVFLYLNSVGKKLEQNKSRFILLK